jgi:hypothetical protein
VLSFSSTGGVVMLSVNFPPCAPFGDAMIPRRVYAVRFFGMFATPEIRYDGRNVCLERCPQNGFLLAALSR